MDHDARCKSTENSLDDLEHSRTLCTCEERVSGTIRSCCREGMYTARGLRGRQCPCRTLIFLLLGHFFLPARLKSVTISNTQANIEFIRPCVPRSMSQASGCVCLFSYIVAIQAGGASVRGRVLAFHVLSRRRFLPRSQIRFLADWLYYVRVTGFHRQFCWRNLFPILHPGNPQLIAR